jgi:hypothetical protein
MCTKNNFLNFSFYVKWSRLLAGFIEKFAPTNMAVLYYGNQFSFMVNIAASGAFNLTRQPASSATIEK